MATVLTYVKEFYWYLSDIWQLTKRNLRHIWRDHDQIFGLIIMPIMYTVLFRYLFGGAMGRVVRMKYIDYLIPGLLVMNILFVSTIACISIATDLKKGLINRLRSLPIGQSSIILGYLIAGVARSMFIVGVVISLGFAMGFKTSADWYMMAQALGLLLLVALGTTSLLMLIGLLSRGVEAAQQFSMIVVISLAMMSSALIPPFTLPKFLRTLVENQPYTRAMEAMRSLLIETPADDHMYFTLLWFGGITLVTFALNYYVFSKKK